MEIWINPECSKCQSALTILAVHAALRRNTVT